MYKNILLGVDTQLKNEKAIQEVCKLAGPDSLVTIVNVISEQDLRASIQFGMHLEELKEKRCEELEPTRRRLTDCDIQFEELILKGSPKEKLVETANRGNYEIVVLSNRKAEKEKKFVLGSVSHKVAKRATIPVLIVK
ncbi:universal stress protein [Staphylococcus massiliensis]|uniref:UspA domain-containing protein n=1 Tax=Staphylococcus massiliensis S46 TaxID=1229783 RepID=K9AVT0_9STAP|nr:universal stress protein [Staphylococcus massiliensis]EKU50211.1 hypothetical protein C273_01165 [Staphylococcus massiliensis S46]MCG3399136.1 universal stress protein [Staphylococcus massiliensis]MCG3400867.1 universal stress protein [Staphylococcus massiliensis]MCG3411969.1 universal stress protein [Staphylococcus massiliensis]PNZ99619.1 universal stress protein [Staphylococcus massiliensis CCUG 55927]